MQNSLFLICILILIPSKTPSILKQFFSSYTWDFYERRNERKIYLTFDDGPIPDVTEYVLEQLDKFEAKATFFCIGDNIQKHPNIFNQIITQDHAIGNHTMSHLKAWKSDPESYIDNILACERIILENSKVKNTAKIFRPPYGQISYSKFKTLEKMGYRIILWDVLSKDWEQTLSPKDCLQNVIKNAQNGSIIVFHDSIKASKNLKFALPKVLEYFAERDFIFEKIQY